MRGDLAPARRHVGAASVLLLAAVGGLLPTQAWSASVFTSGPFTLPEEIVPAPGGGYLVSDGDNDAIYTVPATGGPPTASQPVGFRVFGEIPLTSYYGGNSGTYLAYGTDSTSSNGVGALVGTSGIAAPTVVLNTSSSWYGNAAVAPANYGAIPANSIVLSNDPGGIPTTSGSIEILNPSLSSTTTFARLGSIAAFGVGFAPSTFGAHAGQLFVSNAANGNLYTVSTSGAAKLFATLPLPAGFSQPGLRQFAWAPAGFGAYGGDLFVSVAAQNGGGGSDGEIDVLNDLGKTVALYDQGTAGVPLDPRGLDFISDSTLLVANADPSITEVTPADFVPAGQLLPEPGSLTLLAAGVGGIGIAARRRPHRPV